MFAEDDPRPPPIIHQGPQNQTLPVNSLALLPCLATGNPLPSIRWYKNYKELQMRDPRFALLDSGTLQIAGAVIYTLCCKICALIFTVYYAVCKGLNWQLGF